MKKEAVFVAVGRLSAMKYFPSSPVAKAEIMAALERMVSDEQRLSWLVDTLIDSVDEWPGLRSLRGLYCTRFAPRDGREADCSLPGFRPEDSEAACALEPARLLTGTAEVAMSADELRKFHDELFEPMLRRKRQPQSIDREALAKVEAEIATARPTLSEEEKNRRIREIEERLGINNN